MFKHDVNGVQVSERGWAGHFCLAHKCLFHRNTLLEKDDVKIVVSSVGKMMLKHDSNKLHEIGYGRYYETMVFFAKDDAWHDADASRGEIATYVPEAYENHDTFDEIPANELHDKIVLCYIEKLSRNEELKSVWDD